MRPLAALVATGAAGVMLLAYHGGRFPSRVASHFDTSGTPNDWMDKDSYVLFGFGLFIAMTALFLVIGWMLQRLSPRWFNLPNKEIWLAPEHEAATRTHLASWLFAFGALTNLYMIFVLHEVYRANISDPMTTDNTRLFGGLTIFLVVAVWHVVALVRRYRLPPTPHSR